MSERDQHLTRERHNQFYELELEIYLGCMYTTWRGESLHLTTSRWTRRDGQHCFSHPLFILQPLHIIFNCHFDASTLVIVDVVPLSASTIDFCIDNERKGIQVSTCFTNLSALSSTCLYGSHVIYRNSFLSGRIHSSDGSPKFGLSQT